LLLMAEEDHFDRWESATQAEQEAFFDGLAAFTAAVEARGGAVVAGEGLARPEEAVTVRGGAATDGPYAETTEQVGGFFLLELASLEDARDVAALLPVPTVEVRPCVSG
jgi:hypothetical protein